MSRVILLAALGLTALFALALAALHFQPNNNPASAYFRDCSMPCWEGVQPGVTSVADALTRINAAVGLDAHKEDCFDPPSEACIRYRWASANGGRLSTEMEVGYDEIGAVIAWQPDFRLGDVLLALADQQLRPYGVSQNAVQRNQFITRLYFADSQISLNAQTSCPATSLQWMETPISLVMVDSAPIASVGSVDDFALLLKTFYQTCER